MMRIMALMSVAALTGITGAASVVAADEASEPWSQICAPDAAEPPLAMPAEPAIGLERKRPDPPPAPPSRPVQFMGCLPREYSLRPLTVEGADFAVAVAEEPSSIAAVLRYDSIMALEARIADWPRRWIPADSVLEKPSTVFIAKRVISRWKLADGSTVYAIHTEDASSGMLCLTRADPSRLPEAVPVLNNWCMDRLDIGSN